MQFFSRKTLQRNKNLKSLPKIQSCGECPWQKKGICHVVSAFFYILLQYVFCVVSLVKVSWFQNVFLVLSFGQKNNVKITRISVL